MDLNVTAGFEGTDGEIGEAIDTLSGLAKGVELVNLVTPEKEYENFTIDNVNYARKRENGIGVVYFEIHLTQIRQVAPRYAKAIKKPKNPESAPTADVGKKQFSSAIFDVKKSIGIN